MNIGIFHPNEGAILGFMGLITEASFSDEPGTLDKRGEEARRKLHEAVDLPDVPAIIGEILGRVLISALNGNGTIPGTIKRVIDNIVIACGHRESPVELKAMADVRITEVIKNDWLSLTIKPFPFEKDDKKPLIYIKATVVGDENPWRFSVTT